MTELKTSIDPRVYTKSAKALFTMFVMFWLIWNWQTLYVSMFINKGAIPAKQFFVKEYLFSPVNLLIYPLISATVFLALLPFINKLNFWFYYKYTRSVIKKYGVRERPDTFEEQYAEQEKKYRKLLTDKETAIDLLKSELRAVLEHKGTHIKANLRAENEAPPVQTEDLLCALKAHGTIRELLRVGKLVQKQQYIPDADRSVKLLVNHGLIRYVKVDPANASTLYAFTPAGDEIMKMVLLDADLELAIG